MSEERGGMVGQLQLINEGIVQQDCEPWFGYGQQGYDYSGMFECVINGGEGAMQGQEMTREQGGGRNWMKSTEKRLFRGR